jgi:3-deoxy-D-manno-octulosonic-acid transferase
VLVVVAQEYNEKVNVMLTTASQDAYELLQASLPPRVIIQLVPLDNPVCASLFMKHWRPQVGILMVRAATGGRGDSEGNK